MSQHAWLPSRYKKFASPGWRVFEFLELCESTPVGSTGRHIHPVVTLNNQETSADMADFVEYVYGDATTEYGTTSPPDHLTDHLRPNHITDHLTDHQHTCLTCAWVGPIFR